MGTETESAAGNCFVCNKACKLRCSSCLQVFYCSAEHQKQDWKTHKVQCSPMRVCHNDKIGRHYVATRNIKPGEIVLKESPLIIGPSQVTAPVCVGCLQVFKRQRKWNVESPSQIGRTCLSSVGKRRRRKNSRKSAVMFHKGLADPEAFKLCRFYDFLLALVHAHFTINQLFSLASSHCAKTRTSFGSVPTFASHPKSHMFASVTSFTSWEEKETGNVFRRHEKWSAMQSGSWCYPGRC